MKLGDFDGDGNLDAATANGGSGTVSVLLGDGAGGFGPAATFLTGGRFPRDLVIGDFNADGNDDVAVTNRKSASVAFLAGDGAGALAAAVLFATGAQPTSISTGDFNGDGIIDLAVTCQTTKDISVLLGTGLLVGPQFEEQLRIHYPNVRLEISIATGDLDGDGNDDLVIANRISNTLSYMLGVGNGTFNERVDFKTGDIRFREPVAIALGDFNADGALDVMVANAGTDDVSVLLRVPIV